MPEDELFELIARIRGRRAAEQTAAAMGILRARHPPIELARAAIACALEELPTSLWAAAIGRAISDVMEQRAEEDARSQMP